MAAKAMLAHLLPALAMAALLFSASAVAEPLRGDDVSPYVNGCSPYYTWQSGDTCLSVVRKFCGATTTKTWTQCMGTTPPLCPAGGWAAGTVICVSTCYYNGMKVAGCTGTYAEDESEGLASQ